jgi:hypothetical protein
MSIHVDPAPLKPFRWRLPDGSDIPAKDYVYDIESYPNVWTCTIIHPVTGGWWQFEVSERRNDSQAQRLPACRVQ